jgi:hypothetical protein
MNSSDWIYLLTTIAAEAADKYFVRVSSEQLGAAGEARGTLQRLLATTSSRALRINIFINVLALRRDQQGTNST